MSQHSTHAVPRPASVFAPGGAPWVPIPLGMSGPAADVWRALYHLRRGLIVTAPDRVIADLIDRSVRYVQEGLRHLEISGWIVRDRRHGGRVITITGRLAGGEKPRRTHSHRPAPPSCRPAPPPLNRGINTEEKPAVPPARPTGVPAKGPEPWRPTAKERSRLGRWAAFAAALPPA